MSLWKLTDDATGVPKSAAMQLQITPENVSPLVGTANTLYANSVIQLGQRAPGIFAANSVEMASGLGEGSKLTHAGWQIRTAFTGPILSIDCTRVAGSGIGHSNGYIRFAGGATGNIKANVFFSNVANVLTCTVLTAGLYANTPIVQGVYAGASSTLGAGLAFTITMGGRANRVHYETLVATNSIVGDASNDGL